MAPAPVVVLWTGADTFKEDRHLEIAAFLDSGFAVLTIDIPGTGEAPILASLDAERMFDAVFDRARALTITRGRGPAARPPRRSRR